MESLFTHGFRAPFACSCGDTAGAAGIMEEVLYGEKQAPCANVDVVAATSVAAPATGIAALGEVTDRVGEVIAGKGRLDASGKGRVDASDIGETREVGLHRFAGEVLAGNGRIDASGKGSVDESDVGDTREVGLQGHVVMTLVPVRMGETIAEGLPHECAPTCTLEAQLTSRPSLLIMETEPSPPVTSTTASSSILVCKAALNASR